MCGTGRGWFSFRRRASRALPENHKSDQRTLTAEIARASRTLTTLVKPHKLNVAALGNVVPQLHVHVIARFTDDPAWPRPVWGIQAAQPFTGDEAEIEVIQWRERLG